MNESSRIQEERNLTQMQSYPVV